MKPDSVASDPVQNLAPSGEGFVDPAMQPTAPTAEAPADAPLSGDVQAGNVQAGDSQTSAPPHMGADLQKHIGEQLRAMHHAILVEKVPDRFVELLRTLAEKESRRS